jgi:hypothetical protein
MKCFDNRLQQALEALVGWVALFDPTNPNATAFHGVTTLSTFAEEMLSTLY